MSTVKRYIMVRETTSMNTGIRYASENGMGEWVRHDDYEALRAQVAGLAEALHRARKYIDGIEVDPDLYGEQVKRDPGAATAVLLVIDKALAEAAG